MSSETDGSSEEEQHDWHSLEYIEKWVAKDLAREGERRPILQRMLSYAPFSPDMAVRVLDLGGGYGAVTNAVLRKFPRAQVTLQDYSREMLDLAREYLSSRFLSVKFVQCDFLDRSWVQAVAGPYDLVVSAIALHNLFDMAKISGCYHGIHGLLGPGGCFLNFDHFSRVEGVAAHLKALKAQGFSAVECLWQNEKSAIIKAV